MDWSAWGSFLYAEEGKTTKATTKDLFKRIYPLVKPFLRWVILTLVVIGISTAINMIPPLLTRALIDHILIEKDKTALTWVGVGMLAIPLVDSLLSVASTYFSTRVSTGLTYILRTKLYKHLQDMSIRFFVNTKMGEIVARLNNDVTGAQRAITGTFVQIITNTAKVIFGLVIMFSLEWKLTLIAIGVFPLFILPARKIGERVRDVSKQWMDSYGRMNAIVNETLEVQGVLLCKIFGRQKLHQDKYETAVAELRDLTVKDNMTDTLFYTMVGIVVAFDTALIYWVGGYLVISDSISIGTIVALISYLGMIYGPFSALVNARISFIKSMVSFERVFEVLDLPIEVEEAAHPNNPIITGDIKFDNVSFSYGRQAGEQVIQLEEQKGRMRWGGQFRDEKKYESKDINKWVLRDVKVDIKPGQMIALVGRSGAGKSTMISLLPRLYDVQEGRILLDGVDIRDMSLSHLAEHIGMVTQDCVLFHDTVRNNLLYANPRATDRELEDACRAANIWNFISGLPEGLETIVGERGFKLSGGEKQRVSIARTILKDPKILVLDEATSSLDSESEALIQKALEKLFKNRTSLVIAHRLSTILSADVIVVLDQGHVAESGTHKQLLAQNGIYAMLYNTQFKKELNVSGEVKNVTSNDTIKNTSNNNNNSDNDSDLLLS
jgi:ATP-binding cassette subfamily B protein